MNSQQVQYRLKSLLNERKATLSVAESCTGGQISHLITMVSGSSAYYLGSVTSYNVSVKENVLGVDAGLIDRCGVVSSEVAAAMAEGVRKVCSSTFSLATTGLAEGGDENYPEGTVWIGVSGPNGTKTMIYHCDLGRKENIRRFAVVALRFLERYILSSDNH